MEDFSNIWRSCWKRFFDVIFSVIALVLSLPILMIAAALIKIESKGPIFYYQVRVGKDLVNFNVIKLRTMTDEPREVGRRPVIGMAKGVTKVGYYLRRFKIDELPQLVNILKGDMSVVGPRPSVPAQLKDMSDIEKKRYSVRPGLTGLAQVSGNIMLEWKDRFKYDLNYVENISLLMDIRIILKTVLIVLLGENNFVRQPDDKK